MHPIRIETLATYHHWVLLSDTQNVVPTLAHPEIWLITHAFDHGHPEHDGRIVGGHAHALDVTTTLLDLFGPETGRQASIDNDEAVAAEAGRTPRPFPHTGDLPFDPRRIADVIRIMNRVELPLCQFQRAVQRD